MNGKKLVGLAVAHIPRGHRPSREIRLSRSDQVARRAMRGALRSKVARGRAGAMRGAELPRWWEENAADIPEMV